MREFFLHNPVAFFDTRDENIPIVLDQKTDLPAERERSTSIDAHDAGTDVEKCHLHHTHAHNTLRFREK